MSSSNKPNFFRKTISLLTLGYNKGVILSAVTKKAMHIIALKITSIYNALETIVTSFEEIRATSESSSKHTEKIYENMSEIISSSSQVNKAIKSNIEEITLAAEESQKINSLFKSLENRSSLVKNMTHEIDDVAQQTNILAINASIEAARAGNSGKGFHIIAKEIRSLSSKTQEFATNIEGTINNFHSELNKVQTSFNNLLILLENLQKDLKITGITFDNNNKNLDGSGQMLAEIKAGMAEQTEAMSDGLNSLEEVFNLLRDASTISASLTSSHNTLDQLLSKKS